MREFININKEQITFLDSRFYLHPQTGEPYPSVTTILEAYPKSAQFYEWLKEVGKHSDEVRDNAGEEGGNVHRMCDEYDSGCEISILGHNGKPQFKQIEWAMFERYVEFRNRFPQIQVLQSEKHYYSQIHKVAGTLDRVFQVNVLINGKTEKWLIDLKTSNTLYNHYWLQLSCYKEMYEENTGETIDRCGILWLKAKIKTNGDFGKVDKKTGNVYDAEYILSNIDKCDIQGVGWQLKFPPNTHEYFFDVFKATHKLWLEEHRDEVPRNHTYCIAHKIQQQLQSDLVAENSSVIE
jgi:hypothetical protein